MRLAPNEIASVASKHWTGPDLVIAVAVVMAESKGETEAIGMVTGSDGTYTNNADLGLFQISTKWHALTADGKPGKLLLAGASWRDPEVNARLAREVFDEFVRAGKVGWEAWQVYLSGSYKKYMKQAEDAVKAPWAPPAPPPPPVTLTVSEVEDASAAAVRKVLGSVHWEVVA